MFKVFKKKDDGVLDLTEKKKVDSEVPIPEDIRKKIEKTIAANTQTNIINSDEIEESKVVADLTQSAPEEKPASRGGFFSNFFGGGSSNDESEKTEEPDVTTTTTSSSSPISRSNLIKIRNNFQKLSERISRLTDRIELLEKKVDRVEGR